MIEITCEEEYNKMKALFEMGSAMELAVLRNFDELRQTLLKIDDTNHIVECADKVDQTEIGIKDMQQKNHELFAALVLYKLKK